jgi:CRP/FNR family cyclic AMP-dependent transcriptional regulator
VHLGAAERVLYVIRDLSRMSGVEQTEQGALVAVTKKELGNMAGCSRETASRSLQELEADGSIINQGRKIVVLAVE